MYRIFIQPMEADLKFCQDTYPTTNITTQAINQIIVNRLRELCLAYTLS